MNKEFFTHVRKTGSERNMKKKNQKIEGISKQAETNVINLKSPIKHKKKANDCFQ